MRLWDEYFLRLILLVLQGRARCGGEDDVPHSYRGQAHGLTAACGEAGDGGAVWHGHHLALLLLGRVVLLLDVGRQVVLPGTRGKVDKMQLITQTG